MKIRRMALVTGPTFFRFFPLANTWQGGWGVAGGGGDFSVATQTNDGAASFIQGPDIVGGVGCKIAIQKPGPTDLNNWTLQLWGRKRSGDAGDHPCIGVDINLMAHDTYSTPGVGGGTFGGAALFVPVSYIGAVGGGNGFTANAFTKYVFALTPTQIGDALSLVYCTFFPVSRTNIGDGGTVDTFPEITQVYLQHG